MHKGACRSGRHRPVKPFPFFIPLVARGAFLNLEGCRGCLSCRSCKTTPPFWMPAHRPPTAKPSTGTMRILRLTPQDDNSLYRDERDPHLPASRARAERDDNQARGDKTVPGAIR
jgi:hypothetical protein